MIGNNQTENMVKMLKTAKISFIALAVVLSLVIPFVGATGIAKAQQTTEVLEDFEDGSADGFAYGSITAETGRAIEGDYYGYTDSSTSRLDYALPDQQTTKFQAWIYNDNPQSYNAELGLSATGGGYAPRIRLQDGNAYWVDNNDNYFGDVSTGTWYVIEFSNIDYSSNTYDVTIYDVDGNVVASADNANFDTNTAGLKYFRLSNWLVDLDAFGNENAAFEAKPITRIVSGKVTDSEGNVLENTTISTDAGDSTTTNSTGDYSFVIEEGNYQITASKQNYQSETKTLEVSGTAETVNFELEAIENSLSLEGPNFVRPNKTIPYSVQYTNESGTFDVTDYSNVTSENSTKLSVNEINQTLEAGKYNATVAISAEYNTVEVSKNTTRSYYISYLKLENIDTVPPSKWIQAFLGFDDGYAEGQNMKGIGSDIQWLLFMIIVMSTIAKTFNNPWAGIGSGVITSVLLWVLEYIGLGLLLSSVFFGIFVGLILVRVRRDGGNEVTINES